MAFGRVVQESDIGVVLAPWEAAPNGVVSLLAMLEFSARSYVEISYQFGLVLAALRKPEPAIHDLSKSFEKLLGEANRLSLFVTRDALGEMLLEITKAHPGSVKITGEGDDRVVHYTNAGLDPDRTCHHIEAIYATMKAELGTVLCKAIPREKAKFCDPKWQTTGPMFAKFPESVDELQKAGRCYAYGENTACVFHLLRVADFYFRKVAESLSISYDARNWHGIGKKISEEMEKKYQIKTDEWKKNEPFYAEILTDLQAIGRGHRNPTLHELEKKYEERDAEYMLTVIKSFAKRVAERL
jgi:hypothetical protein